ncbi:uridine kinase, partial [Streptomyces sp. SID6648]|nr:uridine kinase [Streptomyces sp. SID6648]
MRLEAITWDRLGDRLAERLLDLEPADGSAWTRVALDGAPAARPGDLAERIGEALRVRGRPSLAVGTEGFLRPASLRLEYGHQDVESYYNGWYDIGALWREVFDPLGPGGDGRVLPDLWDPVTDRATRSPHARLAPGGVLLLHGPFLL